ncbi:phytanoyl-CoA dioxygenase family protein [Mycobacterium sp.]|jgi:ectoine hydroxylase-related dioxygenase (phytanoyl-CoA dioxygenase family)|uniref:phytanoyl-CoA dioxygenase family protein n=1 Tax=Mycobacterium sp. TaxID=1785 RepID=UPI003C726B8C
MTAVVAQPEGALAEIEELGYTVVKGVLDPASVAAFLEDTNRLARELPTVISNSTTVVKGFARPGQAPVTGSDHDWVRIDNLLLHGARYEALPVHPRVLPVVEGVLGHDCLLSWFMTSNQSPGAVAQRLHSDDEMYPLPRPHQPLLCNALIALCEFTEANGATQVVPGSHRWAATPAAPYPQGQPVELAAGDALIWNGSLWHTAAANRTDKPRPALTVNYCAGFLRQQVDQQLSIPRELVRRFDPRLRELIGYGLFARKMGRIDWRPPADYLDGDQHPFLAAVRDRIARPVTT